ncbi:FG-GAP repeat protein, partial [Bizionia paragorgiae]
YVYRGGQDYKFSQGVSSFNGTLNSANVDGGNGHYIVGVADVNGDKKADLISVHSNGNAYVWPAGVIVKLE